MDQDVHTLYDMLSVLCRQQRHWSRPQPKQKPPRRALEVWEVLKDQWIPIGEEELEYAFMRGNVDTVNFSALRRVLYLPPLPHHDNDCVPVLSLVCGRRNADELKLSFMLVRDDETEKGLVGIGFRMEKGTGEHSFYHAQLIRSLHGNDIVECPRWLPETQPSIPLYAISSATLLLCTLLSIYGLDSFWEMLVPCFNQVHKLQTHLKLFHEWFPPNERR